MKTKKVRDMDTYYLVKEEKIKIDAVTSILSKLGTKKTHKYHPTCITELANKVSGLCKGYVHEGNIIQSIGISTLLSKNLKYRVLLDGFFTSLTGDDSLKLNVSSASKNALRVMVRNLQLKLVETQKEVDILTKRIQNKSGSKFESLPKHNVNDTNQKQSESQTKHDLCSSIFMVLNYIRKEQLALFEIVNGCLQDNLSGDVIVTEIYFEEYLNWLKEEAKKVEDDENDSI